MIRDMRKEDFSTFETVHRESGFDYQFPDLTDPLFIVKVTSEDDGQPVQGIALKIQAECYIWVDSQWATPEKRWEKLQQLTEAAKEAAWSKGLDCIVAVVPPEIADSFEKRLTQIGMTRDRNWPKFSFDLTDYVPNRVEMSAT
jgi:hypothetical protein